MKKFISLLYPLLTLAYLPSHAQIFNRIENTVREHAEDRAVNRAVEQTDKAMDKTEDAISGKKTTRRRSDDSENSGSGNSGSTTTTAAANIATPDLKAYRNYDFVPGEQIIFVSDLATDQVGEIPSQFTLQEGQMDVQEINGEKVIRTATGPTITFTPRIIKADYLPEQFTVEFDFMNQKFGLNHCNVDFGHRYYYSGGEDILPGMQFSESDVQWGDAGRLGKYPQDLKQSTDGDPMIWHHIAIAVNKNTGKLYVDQYRVLNVNNLSGKPLNVTFNINGYEDSYIRNIRIAGGGIDIAKMRSSDGKIVMHGILFDVDKASLKPESMGSINQIYALLQKDPSLKFEIDGHTDNTGNSAHNMTLSQQRADAVKGQLVSMGIDASRLKSKGLSDTKPISGNSTAEGRANNRRVEFVKI